MDGDKFQRAARAALDLLQYKMLPACTYHNLEHTLAVVKACARLAELEGIDAENQHLLLLAAYFHDTGLTTIARAELDAYNAGRAVHEELAVQIAREILAKNGFGMEDIHTVSRLIMATKMAHDPVDLLEQIIADADMSSVGQATSLFLRSNVALLEELRAFGFKIQNAEWYEDQKKWIDTCVYHTASARRLFEENRVLNKAAIQSQAERLHS
jgi:predicted metal-dependent HD superfamily phosphohydrolase